MKRFLIPIFITLFIIFVLFTQISLKDFSMLLKSIDPLWAIWGSVGYFLSILFRALRFKWLIHSMEIPLSELFRISTFYNLSIMVLPSKLGELSYPYLLNKISGTSMTEGVASLIASRIYDFFIILMIFLFSLIMFQRFFNIDLLFIILFAILMIALILIVFFHMNTLLGWVSNVFERISKWSRSKNWKSLQWGIGKIHDMGEDFDAIQAKKTHFRVTLTSLISWIMVFWTFYAFLRGFGIHLSFPKVVFASTLAIITSALPVSGLGNWGMLEVGWGAGFLMVGLPKGQAIALGFGVHIMVFVICAMIAFICWVTLKRTHPPLLGHSKESKQGEMLEQY